MKKTHNNLIYSSDCFSIFPQRGHVETAQDSFRLGPVNMAVLTQLIEQQGQVVSRTALFDSVWKNQVVSDDVLTRSISDIRSQLGKHTQIKLIETLPKRGYRWLPSVAVLDKDPAEKSIENAQVSTPSESLKQSSVTELESSQITQAKNQTQTQKPTKQWLSFSLFKHLVLAMLGLFFIATSALWMVENMIENQLVRIALIPVQGNAEQLNSVSLEIDDILRVQFSQQQELRFLARSAVSNRPHNAFKYFSREFATQWIVEGHVRTYQNKLRLSLSLVDAHTATVSYALIEDVDNKPQALEQHCQKFIQQALEIILPE